MNRTIGIFDSGVGGISVLRHIRAALPDARLIYVADSAHVPYGDKSHPYIEARSLAITRFLIEQGAQAIVIACNTATAAAAAALRARFKLPIVAMEPAVKPAVAATKSGVVGVLATTGTLESARFAALLEKYAGNVKIVTQGCPGLVEAVERGDLHGPEARCLVERYTAPLLAAGADTLILGCTHYPFLAPLIHEVVGEYVALVDTGAAVARELKRRVESEIAITTPSPQPLPREGGGASAAGFSAHAFQITDALPPLLLREKGYSPSPLAVTSDLASVVDSPGRMASSSIREGLGRGVAPPETFYTSGDATDASRIMSVLWGSEVRARQLPQPFL